MRTFWIINCCVDWDDIFCLLCKSLEPPAISRQEMGVAIYWTVQTFMGIQYIRQSVFYTRSKSTFILQHSLKSCRQTFFSFLEVVSMNWPLSPLWGGQSVADGVSCVLGLWLFFKTIFQPLMNICLWLTVERITLIDVFTADIWAGGSRCNQVYYQASIC